ncbi:MAG: hypothetical protein A3H06_02645 [Candidatus Colwellbacteria bacterium RIFCSPLOWO2_12_FULL_44_13]|nr:MAG: hypothetical protein A3A92_02080 [Candidatus Nomurabacteria bacterium RIFCSPLOWO2_01_FULL_37_49]OGY61593.1 MAG: hypothetical protein A3H06_02645 [Candidatus Colwellbacteria bacterium RIFCSPLOWO2_12_FULL_44_13]
MRSPFFFLLLLYHTQPQKASTETTLFIRIFGQNKNPVLKRKRAQETIKITENKNKLRREEGSRSGKLRAEASTRNSMDDPSFPQLN